MKRVKDYKEIIIKGINEGLTTRDICKNLCLSEGAVYRFIKENGLQSNGKKLGKNITITEEDREKILNLYTKENKTIEEIESLYNGKYTNGSITYLLRINNVTRRRGARTHLNDNYFSEINTPYKAYFLGLMFADGSVIRTNPNQDSWTISLELISSDDYILEKFREELELKIKVKQSNREGRNTTSYLHFQSSTIAKDLINLGCIPRKSKQDIYFPNIPEELKRYFILGYFDGDGIACNGKTGKYIGFCGQQTLLSDIEKEIRSTLHIKEKRIYFNRFNNIYYLQYGKKEDIQKIYNYLYSECEVLYLKRKREKLK